MRLFLSYPSESRSQVEEVAVRLRSAGHHAFFAPQDLPTGDSYDDRIRRAVDRSDAFLCFVTPEYLTPGRYTLTELEIAKRRCPPATFFPFAWLVSNSLAITSTRVLAVVTHADDSREGIEIKIGAANGSSK